MLKIIFTDPEIPQNGTDVNPVSVPVHANKTIMFIGPASSFMGFRARDYGYETISAKNINHARDILLSGTFKEKKYLPETIFCDLRIGEHLIRSFAGFLNSLKEFNSVPLILLGNEKDILQFDFEIVHGIDDVVNYNSSFSELIEKIKLLKRFKNLRNKFPYQPALTEKMESYSFEAFASRIMDIVLSLSLLILLSPILILIAIAIKFDSKGSVFYISPRAGKGYRVFKFYKFRTMVADADTKMSQIKHLNQYSASDNAESIFIKIDNDPRITRLGKFLRNTSLDELPQLINVLKGDMSIVGNRPLPLYEASALTNDEFAERFLAPAGITGLWQTKGRGHEKMSAEERINMDIDYAKRHSFFFDLYLLFRTPKGLIQKADV